MRQNRTHHKYVLAAVLLVYSFITILFFLPSMGSIAGSLIGPPGDNLHHFWDMWWVRKVFMDHAGSLAFSKFIYYPEGSYLLFQAYSFYNLFLSFILGKFLFPAFVYNILILSTFALSGLGAFLLIRYLTGNAYAGLVGGFIFAFNPSHFAHSLQHIEIASIQFIPFFVLYFIKSVKGNSKKDIFLASFFFLLNSICNTYYLVLGMYFIGFSYAYLMCRRRKIFLPDVFTKVAIITVPAVLILSPWLIMMAKVGLFHPETANAAFPDIFVTDLLALVTPDPYHPLAWTKAARYINARFTGNPWEMTAYLGIPGIILVLLAFKGIIKKTAKYFLGILSFLIISMGAHLHILGWRSPMPLPYEIVRRIPLLSVMQIPSRAIVYVYLFFAIVVSFSVIYLHRTYKLGQAGRRIIYPIIVLLLFCDYYSVCDVTSRVYCPQAYRAIKSEDGDFGILNLPADNYTYSARYMMHQTFHGIPIVNGYISRKIGKSLINYLEFGDLSRQKEQLSANNVKYIVIHKSLMPKGYSASANLYTKHYKIIYEDGQNLVFQVY